MSPRRSASRRATRRPMSGWRGPASPNCTWAADKVAVEWLRRAIENNRNQPIAHFWLAAALAFLGRVDEARAAAQAGLALDPTFTSCALSQRRRDR